MGIFWCVSKAVDPGSVALKVGERHDGLAGGCATFPGAAAMRAHVRYVLRETMPVCSKLGYTDALYGTADITAQNYGASIHAIFEDNSNYISVFALLKTNKAFVSGSNFETFSFRIIIAVS